ncbi:MAG: helix-turn-helix domain-containing protein [Clostridiales Family XIII bacterium]|jgi:repressor LexA|nr:helix-turn-helix domain-containing protein [Clostridiales Family XIII bacterium]
MKAIAKRLKTLRNKLGYSQSELAKMIGVTQASINRYENDQVTPPPETFLWYADYFGVSLDYIYGRIDDPQGASEKHTANALKDQFSDDEKLRKFVEFCFEPGTSGNDRLKEVIVEMLGGK